VFFQGNNYWASGAAFHIDWQGSPFGDLASWSAATGQEQVGSWEAGLSVNPLLSAPGTGKTLGEASQLEALAAYRLASRSPMINRGLNLWALYGITPGLRDYFGGSLPVGASFDIGAHEFAATQENVIRNRGFERSDRGWVNWGHCGSSAESPHAGHYAARVAGGTGGCGQELISAVAAGERDWVLSGWGKIVGAAGSRAWIGVHYFDTAGGLIGSEAIEFHGAEYTFQSRLLSLPVGTAGIQAWLWANIVLPDVFYADDLSLTSSLRARP
jgi:hypothetical protein